MPVFNLTEAEVKAILIMIAFAERNSNMATFKRDCDVMFRKITEQLEHQRTTEE